MEYAAPMFKKVFEILTLIVPPNKYYGYGMYGVADIFVKVYNDCLLPTQIPLGLSSHTSVKKMYLRHIMHHPEDIQYLDAFRSIQASSDAPTKQALYYFAHTVGGVYTPIKGLSQSVLAKWYEKEINEKQLDDAFDDVIRDERRIFNELLQLGIGISIDANLRLTKKRFARLQRYIDSNKIAKYRELVGPFLVKDSSMLSIKILRRQIND